MGDEHVMSPDAAIREAAYHNAARDVFGLGHLVPTTVAFWNPEDGRLHSAQDFVHGGQHVLPEHQKLWHDQGLSPRMAVMENILGGASDRWEGNVMVAPDGSPRLIDNGFAFQYGSSHVDLLKPAFLGNTRAPWQPDVSTWIQGLDGDALAKSMERSGMHPQEIRAAHGRLARLKQMLAEGHQLGYADLVSA
jgi:hypothetical protein